MCFHTWHTHGRRGELRSHRANRHTGSLTHTHTQTHSASLVVFHRNLRHGREWCFHTKWPPLYGFQTGTKVAFNAAGGSLWFLTMPLCGKVSPSRQSMRPSLLSSTQGHIVCRRLNALGLSALHFFNDRSALKCLRQNSSGQEFVSVALIQRYISQSYIFMVWAWVPTDVILLHFSSLWMWRKNKS